MKKNLPLLLAIFCSVAIGYSQSQPLWKSVKENDLKTSEKVRRSSFPNASKIYNLDIAALRNKLAAAPLRGETSKSNLVIELPNAEGKLQHFRVVETPIMEAALAAKFPMIKSYAAQGIEDPTAVARFSVTQFGLHSMTLSGNESTVFIDPYTADAKNYIIYNKASLAETPNDFTCLTDSDAHLPTLEKDRKANANKVLNTDDSKLRTYRLAQSCTAEYGNIFAGEGTDLEKKANIQAQMAITMTRVNGVYENDLSITLIFVANNDALIYFGNTASDPWNGEYNVQTGFTIDANIGFTSYDIGHNFNTSGGGNAGCIGCVCGPDTNPRGDHKGTGMTGRPNPTGDPFDIDYVAHEMGHQFGGFHIQSSSGCRSGNGLTEVEPGSGSSIMGYAGICNANVQSQSDAYFGYVNIRDILANVKDGISSSCPQISEIANKAPLVNAGADYVIPKSTAFMLVGEATDPDGDGLTYSWEQNDPENPNTSAAPTPTRAQGPMFRSFNSTPSPVRYMPAMATILAGNTSNTWEACPSVARDLNFSLTVRDNQAGAGQNASDLMKVTVSGTAGPFVLNTPNTNVSWAAGSIETITWNVAGTDANGVNAKFVDIYLSSNGGTDFPVLLASKVPNDGSEFVSVPNIPGTQNRIMVRGFENIFFDVSNANFTITAPENTFAPAFTGIAGEQNKTICVGSNISYNFDYKAFGFTGTTTFTVTGTPDGSTASISPNTLNADGTATVQINTTTATVSGFYTLFITATSGETVKTIPYYLQLFNSDFGTTALTSPANTAEGQGTTVNLTWETNENATTYDVEVSGDEAFANIVASGTTAETSFKASGLAELTTYYWRILPKNPSCFGIFTPAFSFKTGEENCSSTVATDGPKAISASGAPTVNSIINVTQTGLVSDVNLSIDLTHTYVGELTATLISPAGTQVILLNSVCESANNIDATFDDSGAEVVCSNNPAISGTVIPTQALAAFNGENANGNWTLRIKDNASGDGGSLAGWSLNLCAVGPALGVTQNQIRNFEIAPNPNKGQFNIKFDSKSANKIAVAVFDIGGRQILSKTYEETSVFNENISLNAAAGIYLVTVTNGNQKETRKIVVQ